MGKIFSKLSSGVAPAQQASENHRTPAMFIEPSIQVDTPVESTRIQRVTTPRCETMLDNIKSGGSVSRGNLEGSPSNSPFNEHEQDATTWDGSGNSPVSPKHNTRRSQRGSSRGLLPDLTPCELHPDTRKKVFRSRWFEEKLAVQVVCEDLRQALQQAVANLPWSEVSKKLFSPSSWITEPFEVIVHNKSMILQHHLELEDGDAKKHLEWFLERLEAHQPGLWQKQDELLSGSCQQVLFKHLWLLYPPGSTVFSIDDGAWRAYVIDRSETVVRGNAALLHIHAYFLDFDETGQRLIPHRAMIEVTPYASERQVSALRWKPEWFIEQTARLVLTKLVEQGNEYFSYGGKPSYKEYDGDAWTNTSHDSKLKVIVDYSTSSKYKTTTSGTASSQDRITSCSVCIGESLGLFPYPKYTKEDPHICVNGMSQSFSWSEVFCGPDVDEKVLLSCPPRLWAFSLKFKTWRSVSYDSLRNIEPPDTSFEQDLFMKDSIKQPLGIIVSAYMKDTKDVKLVSSKGTVGRKGRGLNILLSGKTGTGKTLTAECLSEKFEVPLYSMTCGDLGVQPGLLDQKLQETFTRAANWNTMVLLDDVDTYVYKRDDCELIRNALLPIFLRHLEYSDCLTFVSMSHLGHVDPSFFSRIQIRIGFPNFDFGTQQKIWHRVMSHLPIDYLDKDELQHFINRELGELDNGWYKEMNGSQIRNCIDVALVLARNEASSSSAYKLQSHHIIRILKLGRDFQDYVSQQATETREHVRQTLFMN